MKRHYYISNDLNDLKVIEKQLEDAGLATPQIHVLSEDDAGLDEHRLNKVEAVLKKDVVHGTELGALVGFIAAALLLGAAYYFGLTETFTWIPAIFLAVIILGFCTWEGGLIGIQEPHVDFRRFQDDIRAGKHVLFVDVGQEQAPILRKVVSEHPGLTDAGEGSPTPWFVVQAQKAFPRSMWRTRAR